MVTPYLLKRVPSAIMLAGLLLHLSCVLREREREKLELLVIYYIHEHSVELNDIYIFCSTCGSGGEITLPTISCKIIQGPVLQKQVQQTQDVFSLSGFPEPNSGVMDNL